MSQPETKNRTALIAALAFPAAIALAQAAWFFILDRNHLGMGLPIDDAYIFERYASNLAAGNGFSFNPGETSFGCTSLLWPLLLAVFYKIMPFAGHMAVSFWVGAVIYAAAAAGSSWVVAKRTGNALAGSLAGLLVAASPIMLMNGISGMETSLSVLLLVVISGLLLSGSGRPALAGLVAGLMTLNRPESVYFPIGFLIAWLISRALRDGRISWTSLLRSILPWALLAVPAGLIVHHQVGTLLPGTYLGKIMSTDPGALERSVFERAVWGLLSLGDGWLKLAAPFRAASAVIIFGVVVEAAGSLLRTFRREGSAWTNLGAMVIFGFLFLPAAYGVFFPVGPPFGGYYFRYIAPVYAGAVILGTAGLHALFTAASARRPAWKGRARVLAVALVVIGLLYLARLWVAQMADAKDVFGNEVRLNTGLRMEAARWIADNTPADARVMVGYTGLGVVGGSCGRYVLDLGALINPDIFDYYAKAGRSPQKRWDRAVEYMHDKDMTHFVTFAFPEDYSDRIADPGLTPGFIEVARLGAGGKAGSLYERIVVYRIDWKKWEAGEK